MNSIIDLWESVARQSIEDLYLDMLEEECWRMFGIQIDYYHDERMITTP